jgi:hypothetical protein
MLESTRVNFTAPTLAGRSKKNQESSRLPTVMTLGGVLQTPLQCLLQEKIIGPVLDGSWRQTLLGGGGSPEDSSPAVRRGRRREPAVKALIPRAGMLVLLRDLQEHQSPILVFIFCSCQRSGNGETTAMVPATFSRDLGRLCLAWFALFQDGKVKDPRP